MHIYNIPTALSPTQKVARSTQTLLFEPLLRCEVNQHPLAAIHIIIINNRPHARVHHHQFAPIYSRPHNFSTGTPMSVNQILSHPRFSLLQPF